MTSISNPALSFLRDGGAALSATQALLHVSSPSDVRFTSHVDARRTLLRGHGQTHPGVP
jgi:hypothetical protein